MRFGADLNCGGKKLGWGKFFFKEEVPELDTWKWIFMCEKCRSLLSEDYGREHCEKFGLRTRQVRNVLSNIWRT